MADVKISQLTELSSANLAMDVDVLAVVDNSASATKKISAENLLAPIVINKATGVITNLGAVTTCDINGGTIDGITSLTGGTGDLVWDTTTLVVDSSENKVGIGTASIDHELHVEGENPRIQIESTSAGADNTGLIFAHGGTEKYEFWHDEDVGAFNFDQSVQTDGWGFNFRTYPSGGADNTTAMTIKGDGKVGIGTTSPSANFDVRGSGVITCFGDADARDSDVTAQYGAGIMQYQFQNGSATRGAVLELGGDLNAGEIMGALAFFRSGNTDGDRLRAGIDAHTTSGTDPGGKLRFSTAADGETVPSIRMLIDESGNVGINTVPAKLLHIKSQYGTTFDASDPNDYGPTIQIDNVSNTANTAATLLFTHRDNSVGYAGISSLSDGGDKANLLFFTRDDSPNTITERMRIDYDGRIGCRITAPQARLHVDVSEYSNTVGNADSTFLLGGSEWGFQQMSTQGDNGFMLYGKQGGTARKKYEIGRGHNNSNDYHKWYTNDTERMSIDSNGTLTLNEHTGDADSSKMLFKSTKSYTNNEHENFTLVGNGSLIMISDTTSNDCGLFFATYNSGTVIEIADPQGEFANSDTSGQICCYKGSATNSFQVKNTRGPTKNLSVAVIGCGS